MVMMTASLRIDRESAVHQDGLPHTALLDYQRRHLGLLNVKVGLALEDFLHPDAILLLITLRTRRPDGWPAAGIEKAKLDSDRIGDFGHNATQRASISRTK